MHIDNAGPRLEVKVVVKSPCSVRCLVCKTTGQVESQALRPYANSTSDAYLDVRASAWELVSDLAPSPMNLGRGEAQHIAAYLDEFSLRPQFHTQPILTKQSDIGLGRYGQEPQMSVETNDSK